MREDAKSYTIVMHQIIKSSKEHVQTFFESRSIHFDNSITGLTDILFIVYTF